MREYYQTFIVFLASLALLIDASGAVASTLVFTGQNAAIFNTANPADTSAMMNSVVKPNNPNPISATSVSQAQFILQSLESQITSKDYNQIFNTASGQAGTFQVGTTVVTYDKDVTNPGFFTITIATPGQPSTTITVPD